MKRLFYDIETSLGIFTAFSAGYNKTISHHDIVIHPAIICICYKWGGDNKVHSLEWRLGDDKKLIKEFVKVLEKADEIVAHNGDGFDLPWIRGRAIKHGIPMGYYVEVDTLKLAKKRAGQGFKFQSNRLDHLARYLEVGKKVKTTPGLWYDISIPAFIPAVKPVDDEYHRALAEMVKYCKADVRVLERVYEKLKPYSPVKTHMGVHLGGNRWDCAKCGSGNTKVNKRYYTAAGMERINWVCLDCKTYSHTTPAKIHIDKLKWELDRRHANESLK